MDLCLESYPGKFVDSKDKQKSHNSQHAKKERKKERKKKNPRENETGIGLSMQHFTLQDHGTNNSYRVPV